MTDRRGADAQDETIFASEPKAAGEKYEPGKLLGRYEVVEELGVGGMGQVLEVLDDSLGRVVAAKTMLGQAGDLLRAKFVQEARITGRLQHPNIIPVHELGVTEDGLYYTMKRVQGRDLSEILEQENRSLPVLLGIFTKICNALALAHSESVIHRDLKPANVMVGEFGEVLVVDWGLAKVLGQEDPLAGAVSPVLTGSKDSSLKTMDGSVMGTPQFMPPEQARGEVDRIDARSDIYSLGAVLYQILTGEPPFDGDDPWQIIGQVTEGRLIRPSDRTPERTIPWELEAVVLRAMQPDPEQRYQTVENLRADLERFLEGQTLAAAHYTTWQVLRKWAARHAAAVTAASVVCLIGLVLAIVSFVRIERAGRETLTALDKLKISHASESRERANAQQALVRATAAHKQAQTARDQEARARRKTELLLSQALLSQARVALTRQRLHDATIYLAAARETADTPHSYAAGFALRPMIANPLPGLRRKLLSSFSGIKLYRTLDAKGQPQTEHWQRKSWHADRRTKRGLVTVPFAISADGKLLAIPSHTETAVEIWRLDTRKLLLTLTGHFDRINALTFSRGGLLASASRDNSTRIWNVNSGQLMQRLIGHRAEVVDVAFSEDGKRLATGSRDKSTIIWSVADGKPLHQLPSTAQVSAVSISHGKLATGEALNNLIKIWDLDTGKLLNVCRGHTSMINDLSFSPGGGLLASASIDKTVRLWKVETGALLQTLAGHRRMIESVSFGPGGRLQSGDRTTVRRWSVQSGKEIRVLYAHARARWGRLYSLDISPDSQLLATAGNAGTIKIWRLRSAELVHAIDAHFATVRTVTFSRDGSLLVSASEDATAKLWEVASGKLLQVYANHESPLLSAAISPDARLLATGSQLGQVTLWNLRSGALVRRLEDSGPVEGLAFSPDGRLLATPFGLWQVASGARQVRWKRPKQRLGIHNLAFAPSGKFVAVPTGSEIRLHAVPSGKLARRFRGHTSWVSSCAFSPDGRLLISGARDASARFWNVATGAQTGPQLFFGPWFTSLAFAPDGRTIAAGMGFQVVQVVGLDTPPDLKTAERLASSRLAGVKLEPLEPTGKSRANGPPALWSFDGPLDAIELLEVGTVQQMVGRPKRAAPWYDQALQRNAERLPFLQLRRGLVCKRTELPRQVKLLERALASFVQRKDDHGRALALCNIGLVQLFRERRAEARAALEAALKTTACPPAVARDARIGLALVANDAAQLRQLMPRKTPIDLPAFISKYSGRSWGDLGLSSMAIKLLPKHPAPWLFRGLVYERFSMRKLMLADLQEAARLANADAVHAPLRGLIARVLKRAKKR